MSEETNQTETSDRGSVTSEPTVITGAHLIIDSEAAGEVSTMTKYIEISTDEMKIIGAHQEVEVLRVEDQEAGKGEERSPPNTNLEMNK